MSVVNVKVKHIRPAYKDLSEWMKNPNNVYIGRRGIVFIDGERFPKLDSIWHNPFKIDSTSTSDSDSRDDVISKYETYIRKKILNDLTLRNELLKLKGKNLGCWCHPNKCHGDILLKILNEIENDK